MVRPRKVTVQQLHHLLKYMEQHKDLAKNRQMNSPQGHARAVRLWQHLATGLNNIDNGVHKNYKEWRNVSTYLFKHLQFHSSIFGDLSVLESFTKDLPCLSFVQSKEIMLQMFVFQYWNEVKYRAKKKASQLRAHARNTGGGPSNGQLTDFETRVLDILETVPVEGNPSVPLPVPVSLFLL